MNDMRKNMDAVAKGLLGDGFANVNSGINGAPDRGFEPNPEADPADVERAWREVIKQLKPEEWKQIAAAARVPENIIRPRADPTEE